MKTLYVLNDFALFPSQISPNTIIEKSGFYTPPMGSIIYFKGYTFEVTKIEIGLELDEAIINCKKIC